MPEVKIKDSLSSPAFSFSNKLLRLVWGFVYLVLFRFSPVPFFSYRRGLLKLFGASIGKGVGVYPSVTIWLPSHLQMHDGASLGPRVNIYNQGQIEIGKNSIISQGAHLCASTHNYNDPVHPLILAPIKVGANVWVCTDAFVGPGVTVAEGSVIGARAVLMKSTNAWNVYAGNPAVKVNEREKF